MIAGRVKPLTARTGAVDLVLPVIWIAIMAVLLWRGNHQPVVAD